MMRHVLPVFLLAFAFVLGGCSLTESDKTPDYRYRLTVEVDTPEGLKIGSSVIEVEQVTWARGVAARRMSNRSTGVRAVKPWR